MKNSSQWSSRQLAAEVLRTAAQGPYGAARCIRKERGRQGAHWFSLGRGRRRLLLTAALHANEWITAPLLMKFAHELASGVWPGVLDEVKVWFAPLANPDGTDLGDRSSQLWSALGKRKTHSRAVSGYPLPRRLEGKHRRS